MAVPPLTLELGLGLVPLVDSALGGDLKNHVAPMRLNIAMELGFITPGIQFRDNARLRPDTYQILVKEVVVAQGRLQVGHFLAVQMDVSGTSEDLVGEPTSDPCFGKPAVWIGSEETRRAEQLGYLVQDHTSVLLGHLQDTVRRHAWELLSREEVHFLLEGLRATTPGAVLELVLAGVDMGDLQAVLQNLLREGVSIRDLATILEQLSDCSGMAKDPLTLTERVRTKLAHPICASVADENGVIEAITVDPRIEQAIKAALEPGPLGPYLALDQLTRSWIVEGAVRAYAEGTAGGTQAVMLCDPAVRPHLRTLLERNIPLVIVLAYSEIHPTFRVQRVSHASMAAAGGEQEGEQRTEAEQAAALAHLRRAAELGDAWAQYELGQLLNAGQGVELNEAEAARCFRKAADQGHAAAQFDLGCMYRNGVGVPVDIEAAIAWYHKAAERGYVAAQFNLGLAYHTGVGVSASQEAAATWWRKAAEQGDAGARSALARLDSMGEV